MSVRTNSPWSSYGARVPIPAASQDTRGSPGCRNSTMFFHHRVPAGPFPSSVPKRCIMPE
eukprot:753548-Hanusia_phi.AAC.3